MSGLKTLIENMITAGTLRTPRIIRAFEQIDRRFFVPDQYAEFTYVDRPLPIGGGQTISQPTTVAFMLELLQPKEGNKVLDIGSGSGWTTALLGSIVGSGGSVVGLERVDGLTNQGCANLAKLGLGDHCRIQGANGELGLPGERFDRILVSAAADQIPEELFDQLEVGGRLVVPVKNSIYLIEKNEDGTVSEEEYYGFVFVPLIY